MVHLPMVHLRVLHLLAMHLIGLQLVQCLNMPTVVFSQRSLLCRCNLSCTSSWCASLWCTSPWCTFMYCIFLLCTLLGCNLYSASILQQSSFACNLLCTRAPLQTSFAGSKHKTHTRARGEQVMRRRTHGGTLAWVNSIPSLEQEVGTITTGSHGPGHNYHRFPHLG